MKMIDFGCFIIILAAINFSTPVHADDSNKDIFVSNAWVQAMPPSQTTTAAYMTITNNSQKEIILVKASSDIAAAAEIHHMSDTNGMMTMGMVLSVHVPALGKVTLQPGGFHVMLIHLKKVVNKGDIVPIKLYFQDGREVLIQAQAKLSQQDDSPGMSGMKM